LREEDGLPPIKDDYADVVLNPQSVQIYLNSKAAEQQQQMGGAGADGGMGDFNPDEDNEVGSEDDQENDNGDSDGQEESQGSEVDWQDAFNKSMKSGKKTIRVVIE
jgi:hypothetical protein